MQLAAIPANNCLWYYCEYIIITSIMELAAIPANHVTAPSSALQLVACGIQNWQDQDLGFTSLVPLVSRVGLWVSRSFE